MLVWADTVSAPPDSYATMQPATISGLVLDGLRQHARPDLLWHKQGGVWRPVSTATFLARVFSLAASLEQMGVRAGDRVTVFSENRPEWHMADCAILGRGAVNVPIYQAESVERLRYILGHSEAKVAFVSGHEQWEKVRSIWGELPKLETVIPFSAEITGGLGSGQRMVAWKAVAREPAAPAAAAAFESAVRARRPDDPASLIYTSGTTGTPKGAVLIQDNFASNVQSTLSQFRYGKDDVALSLLPLCHIYERTLDYTYLVSGVSIVYAESFDRVTDNLKEMRPTVMAVVPRFFEKFSARLLDKVRTAPAAKQKLFDWALRVGRAALPYRLEGKAIPGGLGLRYRLAEWLVYRRLRAELGGRMKMFISGGGPLSRELNEFFHALGLTIYEGYGLTETSPVIAVNVPGSNKLGTVGRPIPGVEVQIAEDGEILTRGPHIMKEYYKMEAETREALAGGWFHTGDIGFLDDEGYLTITDRKKDLLKTAGGKYIAPQPIENRLRQSPYIQNAVVVGDRRRYAVALLVPNLANLENLARQQGVAAASPAELLERPEVRQALEAEVEKVNQDLAQYERLKRFALLEADFTFDNGQLTYTQKVRRRKVEERYHDVIERLYDHEPAP